MGEGRSDKNVDFAFQMTGDGGVDHFDKKVQFAFEMAGDVKVSKGNQNSPPVLIQYDNNDTNDGIH